MFQKSLLRQHILPAQEKMNIERVSLSSLWILKDQILYRYGQNKEKNLISVYCQSYHRNRTKNGYPCLFFEDYIHFGTLSLLLKIPNIRQEIYSLT